MNFASCFEQNTPILLEGALGERLKREFGLLPDEHIAWAYLVYTEQGRNALATLWREYIGIAVKHALPFAATAPTRRANRERVQHSAFGAQVIADNMRFLRQITAGAGTECYAGGLMGCRGDAYTAADALQTKEAERFHAWQANLFAAAGADFLYAGIMPALPEAIGMAKAMEQTGLPYVISFMIRNNGCLIDGTPICEAIERIDGATRRKPLCYMTNCVHPTVLHKALRAEPNRAAPVRERFCGIQANTSPLPPELLDGSAELQCSGGAELADGIAALKGLIPLKIVGGCCGTDASHIEAIAALLQALK